MTKLAKSGEIHDPKTLLNVALIYKQLMEFWKRSDKEWMTLRKIYEAKGQENIDFESREIDPDKRLEFEEKAHEFHDEVAIINRPLIDPKFIAQAGLTPSDILALEPLLDMTQV